MHKETFRFLSLLDHGGSLAIVNGNEAGSPNRKEQGWPGKTGRQVGQGVLNLSKKAACWLPVSAVLGARSLWLASSFFGPALFIILALRQLLHGDWSH